MGKREEETKEEIEVEEERGEEVRGEVEGKVEEGEASVVEEKGDLLNILGRILFVE